MNSKTYSVITVVLIANISKATTRKNDFLRIRNMILYQFVHFLIQVEATSKTIAKLTIHLKKRSVIPHPNHMSRAFYCIGFIIYTNAFNIWIFRVNERRRIFPLSIHLIKLHFRWITFLSHLIFSILNIHPHQHTPQISLSKVKTCHSSYLPPHG